MVTASAPIETPKSTYDLGFNPWIARQALDYLGDRPSASVLDVGCWKGAMGKYILDRMPNATVDGIEGFASPDEAISRGYHTIFSLDLDNYSTLQKDIPDNIYDILILGDVLEHTRSPEKTLEILLRKVRDNGIILCSLPNIGFLQYRLMLLCGRWTYSKPGVGGVMDVTHLRFFTLHSMRVFFQEMGLHTDKKEGLSVVQDKFFFLRFLAKIFPSIFALQIEFLLRKNK